MEKALKNIFIILAALPTMFILGAILFYYQARNWYGELPEGNFLMSMDPSSTEGKYSFAVYRVGVILLQVIPFAFLFLFLCSALSYFFWRHRLPLKHFYLQAFCYLPFLVMVILLRVPAGNPINWFIHYLVN